jgi:hypothetical protein
VSARFATRIRRLRRAIAGVATLTGVCVVAAGCGSYDVTESAPPSQGAGTSLKARCDSIDLVTPNWQNPANGALRVDSVAAARRITRLPLVLPRGLQQPAAIYAMPVAANFVYHGSASGDVIVVEGKPEVSPADWQQELKVMPAQNGKPHVTGTAKVVDLGDGAKALQTKNPCITGSTTDWYTRDHRMEIIIEAHTLHEDAGARIAHLTEQAVGQ